MTSQNMSADYAVVGGGIVGLSVAYGLLKLGKRVSVFDEGDVAFRASRGNFGLIWVQGKGLHEPAYAKWTRTSAHVWPDHAEELEQASGESLALRQGGGLDYHFNDETLSNLVTEYERLKSSLNNDYPFEVLDHQQLKKEEPNIGPKVVGAVLHYEDGHVNPLNLLRALTSEVRRLGGTLLTNNRIDDVRAIDGGYELAGQKSETCFAEKVVICAGIGSAKLGEKLGFVSPISPERGQILITEKLPPIMNRPSGVLRQVNEGGVQIGASNEDVGFDDRETLPVAAKLAQEAVSVFPVLSKAKIVRSWSALRIMSPDGLPIYQKSKTHPGVSLVTCHSGITLSAAHARFMPLWLEDMDGAPNLNVFSEDRFYV